MSEVVSMLKGSKISVLRQLDGGRTGLSDIAEEIEKSGPAVNSAYQQLKHDGYIEKESSLTGGVSITSKGLEAIQVAEELASVDGADYDEDIKVMEIMTVNKESIMYKGGYIHEGSPDEISRFNEGQYSRVKEKETALGMKRVDVIDHPIDFGEYI